LNIVAGRGSVNGMRMVIFGASGPTGRQLTSQALAAGHSVVAVARRSISSQPSLTVVSGDVTSPGSLDAALEGAEVVLSALGVPPSRRPISIYSQGVAAISAAMKRHGVSRLLAVSSSVMDPRWRPSGEHLFNYVLDPLVNRRVARTAHDDMRRMESYLRDSDLSWTLVRPSGLFSHPSVTDYQVAPDVADGLFTARSDLAAAMLAFAADDRFVHRAMAVITTAVRPRFADLVLPSRR
jgi:putative NADH-flavin reductase